MSLSRNSAIPISYSCLSNYHSNGIGRDSYITFDNGGNRLMYEPTKYADIGTTYINRRHDVRPFRSNLFPSEVSPQPKNTKYRLDGSGRDTYIA